MREETKTFLSKQNSKNSSSEEWTIRNVKGISLGGKKILIIITWKFGLHKRIKRSPKPQQYSNTLATWCEGLIHWKRPWCWESLKAGGEGQRMRRLDGIMDSMDMLLLLLSRVSCVQLCVTLQTAAHQAPPSLGFSRQEHWSGLPFPSPMHARHFNKCGQFLAVPASHSQLSKLLWFQS